jgi:hypothetical protein
MGMLVAYLGAQEFSLPSISIHSPRRNSGTSVHVPKLHLHVGQKEKKRKGAGEERVEYLLGVVYAKPRKCAQPSSAHLRAFALIFLSCILSLFLSPVCSAYLQRARSYIPKKCEGIRGIKGMGLNLSQRRTRTPRLLTPSCSTLR